MKINNKNYRTVWMEDKIIKIINQSLLPHSFEILELKNYKEVANAIKTMHIRGAPAIGAIGAFGLAQATNQLDSKDFTKFKNEIKKIRDALASTRPTARDLFDGLEVIEATINNSKSIEEVKERAIKQAQLYADNNVNACKKIGDYGEKLIKNNYAILTHCNAGALATVDYGTALAPIRMAHYNKKDIFVFVDETRPRCQGSRLTAFELAEEGIKHAIIADNAAGHYIKEGKINIVITGADRIALNGDAANKIGTYEKAVLAKENKIPFYIAAPLSTIDINTKTGKEIVIEERSEDEVTHMFGWNDDGKFSRVRISPEKSHAKNPAFDVTPARYIKGIITEKGIIKADEKSIRCLF